MWGKHKHSWDNWSNPFDKIETITNRLCYGQDKSETSATNTHYYQTRVCLSCNQLDLAEIFPRNANGK